MKNKLKQKNNVQKKVINQTPVKKDKNNSFISKQDLFEKINSNSSLIVVRVRPLNSNEKEDSDYKTIKVISNNSLIVSIPTEYSFEEKNKVNHIKVTKEKQSKFEFDFVFDENTSQSQVYEYTTFNLIEQIIEGYNATVLAYGATGTGKTYTMLGEGSNEGIMIRVIKDLFFYVNENINKDKNYIIKISYIEIYNEIIKDLLNNNNTNSTVELRSDAKNGLILKNALIKKVSSETEAFNLIIGGNKNRTEKNTEYNKNSSRSHAILNIYIEIEDQELNVNQKKTFGKFMLLDLAGNEKTSFNYNIKNKEIGSINKSLLALNKCINLLVSKNRGFIPWRDSNLTRLLQEPLSGNGKLVIIATISMALASFDETMFTLQFAKRARNIKLNMKKNIITNKKIGISKFDNFIGNIKEEIVEVKNNILKQDNMIDNIKSNNNVSEIKPEQKNKKEESIVKKDEKIKEKKQPENKCEKVYKDMVEHFKSEINLKKKIMEKENIIEELKNDMIEKEYEILHSNEINLPPLKEQLKEKKEEINDKTNKLLKGYIKQTELIKKRKDFQKFISFLSNNNPKSPYYYKIYNIYKYNINLLENMTIEQKNYINIQESRRKDRKIEGLMEQLDLRDKFIREVYDQFEKNNIVFNYQNPNLIKSNDIDNFSFQPPIIKINEANDSFKPEFKNRKLSFKKSNEMNENEKTNNEGNIEKKIVLKKIKLKNEEKDKNKEQTDETYNNSKQNNNNLYKNEISAILSKRNNGLNINDFIRKRNTPKNPSSLSSYNKKPLSLSPIMRKVNMNELRDKGTFSEKMIGNKRINFNPEKNNDVAGFQNKSMIVNLETEIQKKIKTILNKNYIARYKKSPFLRLLNE